MFKMLGTLWALLTSLFTTAEVATTSLDNLVNETLLASRLSLTKKGEEYKEERAKLKITDDELADILKAARKPLGTDSK